MARTPDSRLERLEQIELKLAQRPVGWTISELASEFCMHRATIHRDILLLKSMGAKIDRRGLRYILDKRGLLHAVKVSTDELLAIYLAVRLLSRHSDEHNPHVVTALEKLAAALQEKSPLIARHIKQAAIAVHARQPRLEYVRALEILTQGWAEGRKVRLRYHSYTKNETTERTFAPYFIEPSGIGYSTYVIGHDDLRGTTRTFKVERVYDAEISEQTFAIPAGFDPQHMLASAWGVIWRDETEVTVVLRFAPSVVRRVKESTWHHSQKTDDLPDGSCLFTVKIGSTREMLPWVRGWGAAVEVLEPVEFRQEMIAEVRQMMHLYDPEDRTATGETDTPAKVV
jgi:predicted DNA-binding transcriptional regulator YafY